jgi:hypothetical protein
VLEPPECFAVDDPVAVPLVLRPYERRLLWNLAALAIRAAGGMRGQSAFSLSKTKANVVKWRLGLQGGSVLILSPCAHTTAG